MKRLLTLKLAIVAGFAFAALSFAVPAGASNDIVPLVKSYKSWLVVKDLFRVTDSAVAG